MVAYAPWTGEVAGSKPVFPTRREKWIKLVNN